MGYVRYGGFWLGSTSPTEGRPHPVSSSSSLKGTEAAAGRCSLAGGRAALVDTLSRLPVRSMLWAPCCCPGRL